MKTAAIAFATTLITLALVQLPAWVETRCPGCEPVAYQVMDIGQQWRETDGTPCAPGGQSGCATSPSTVEYWLVLTRSAGADVATTAPPVYLPESPEWFPGFALTRGAVLSFGELGAQAQWSVELEAMVDAKIAAAIAALPSTVLTQAEWDALAVSSPGLMTITNQHAHILTPEIIIDGVTVRMGAGQ